MRRYSVIMGIFLIASLSSGVANATILNGSQITDAGQNMTVDLTIDTTLNTVAIVMTGPEAVWFGVGFEPLTHPSGETTYSIIPLGGASAPDVQEWALGMFGPDGQLADSLSVDLNTVSAGVRTVELSGLQAGANYTYPTTSGPLDISWAYGSGTAFGYHAARGETTLLLNEVPIPEPSTLLLGIAGFGVLYLKGGR
jgi:hypothetical protein